MEALFLEEEKEQRKIADGIEGIEEDLIEVREALETVRQKIDLIVFLLVLLIFSFGFAAWPRGSTWEVQTVTEMSSPLGSELLGLASTALAP